ncbi:MAG: ABC transporter permease [Promethearchaeota archaeon]
MNLKNIIKLSWRDFKNQKVRAVFGISGILISVLLLSAVGILIDSLNYNYMDVATAEAGSADIQISKTISVDLTFNPYFDLNIIEENLEINNQIDFLFPRIMELIDVEPLGNSEEKTKIIFYGIDTVLEQNSNRLGNLILCDHKTLEETNQYFQGPIQEGNCIILENTAKILNVTVGDVLTISHARYTKNLTITAICIQDLRFSMAETNLVITELSQAQSFLNEEGRINYVMITLKNREYIYNTRDIAGTTQKILDIGSEIQNQLGLDYVIELPKMQSLESTESESMMIEVMMYFVTFLAMLISAILINSILMTSIEERIREFGVQRVLGAKSRENILMVIAQGLFIGVIGTVFGILLSVFLVPPILTAVYQFLNLEIFQIIILPETIIQNFLIGILVTLVISIFPALKAGNLKITQAIDPFRHKEEGYILKKEGSPNVKIILIGLSISTIGVLIFIFLPRIMVTQDLSIVTSLFIGLLLAILIGLVFALIGLIPAVEWLVLQIFRPFIRKYYPIVKLSLKRNRRRNTGNILMFSLTFSFIFFISSYIEISAQSTKNNLEFQYGADLVIFNQGTVDGGDSIDLEFYSKIIKMQGIKETSPILSNSIDMSEIVSVSSIASESGDLSALFSFFQKFSDDDKYDTFVGSVTAFHQTTAGLIGVNQSYVNMANENYFIWDTASGSNTAYSFSALFDSNRNDTIILSKNMADLIGITQVDQKVRMTFADSSKGADGETGNATTMTVVGITGGMPGFFNFRSSSLMVSRSGVMCSMKNYLEWMNEGSIMNKSTPLDKILINLKDTSTDSIKDIKSLIIDLYGNDYSFIVDDNVSKIDMMTQNDATLDAIMEVILTMTIVIALFGLISTMYSIMLERMFEVGLMRAMGLRSTNVQEMFIVESLVLMLAAGTLGLLIGSVIAFFLMDNIAMITEMPVSYLISVETFLRTYLISVSLCIIGILAITRKIRKWSIMDIFRQSF